MQKDYSNNNTQEDVIQSIFKSEYANLSASQLAEKAVDIATKQLMASSEFKKPRLARLQKYWDLYDGRVSKKLRQLFNVPLPVFAGMIDTLNSQYDSPIQLKFTEGDPSDYFKVQKINGAFNMEMANTAENSRWESKLRMARKHAIMNGRAILRYDVSSVPEYTSKISNVNLKYFHFQPKGGSDLEKHLFCGEEGIQRTKYDLVSRVENGEFDKDQVYKLINTASQSDYLPEKSAIMAEKLNRFRPLGLDANNNSYVGQTVYNFVDWILEIEGCRYYLCFEPWTKTWVRFDKWKDICSSNLYPWVSYATHEDDENFLSKSYGDDLYTASDSIVAMFNQELTNREKRNFGARAYDKDMFKDVKKLDDAMHRPDALVPADTKGGSRRIAEGIYEFKVGELGGTVSLIDWITNSLGRNTGATELSMGQVQDVSKKASVTFAEQKAVSKRISWASASFQDMVNALGKRYIYGLKDHMPSSMAIKILGEYGWDWDQITRLDLNTTKDVDVLIISTDKQMIENDMKSKKRAEALASISSDSILSSTISPQWRVQEILKNAEYNDIEIAGAMDTKTFQDKKSIAHASDAIQQILKGQKPQIWFGATVGFIKHITYYARDHRTTLGDKFKEMLDYAMAHKEIVMQNIEVQAQEDAIASLNAMNNPVMGSKVPQVNNTAVNPGMSGGMSRAMSIGEAMV